MNKHSKKDAEIIERLKKNEKPFGLLTVDEHRVIRLTLPHVEYFSDDAIWIKCCEPSWIVSNAYRISPDYTYEVEEELPPKPSQEWLDKHGVELTGDYRRPVGDEYWYLNNSAPLFGCGEAGLVFANTLSDKSRRWIVRKKQPATRPWGRAEWERAGMVRDMLSSQNRSYIVAEVADDCVKVKTNGNWRSFTEAAQRFTQLDGSPCTVEVK